MTLAKVGGRGVAPDAEFLDEFELWAGALGDEPAFLDGLGEVCDEGKAVLPGAPSGGLEGDRSDRIGRMRLESQFGAPSGETGDRREKLFKTGYRGPGSGANGEELKVAHARKS